MRRLAPLPVLLLAAALPCAGLLVADDPKEVKNFALLVGVNEYEHTAMNGDDPLKYAEADVTELKDLLEKSGYKGNVILLAGDKAKRKAILDQVAALKEKGNARGTVLVAVAGHGVQFEKDDEAYFCPYDTKMREAVRNGKPVLHKNGRPVLEPVPDSCVKLSDIVGGFKTCPAGSRILLADCCRNDPATGRGRGTGAKVNWDAVADDNTAVLLSCSQDQRAFEDKKWGHGAFFFHVLKGLRDGKTTVAGLNGYLAEEVPKAVAEVLRGETQDPQPRIKSNKVTFNLLATKDADETVEEFEWKGEKRKRTVRVLKIGELMTEIIPVIGERMVFNVAVEVEFVKVPKGKFKMGSPESDKDAQDSEKPQHTVTFTKDLWVAKHPVTREQFAAFVEATGYKTEAETDGKGGTGFDGKEFKQDAKYTWKETGWDQTAKHPVVNVTWNDAEAYTKWASKVSKLNVRLLTEAEYEYMNRGGTDKIYFTGDDVASLDGYANVGDKSAKAKFSDWTVVPFDDGSVFTSPVGTYKPNGYGLYDTTGNVWSWCADWYDEKLYQREGVTDPKANADGEQKYRVLRGGSWGSNAWGCRAAVRHRNEPAYRHDNYGFRVVFCLD